MRLDDFNVSGIKTANTSFSVKNMWFVSSTNHMILHTFVISLPSLDMPYNQHENIIPCVEFNIV